MHLDGQLVGKHMWFMLAIEHKLVQLTSVPVVPVLLLISLIIV